MHTFNPITQKVETGRSLYIQDLCTFKASQGLSQKRGGGEGRRGWRGILEGQALSHAGTTTWSTQDHKHILKQQPASKFETGKTEADEEEEKSNT